MKQIIIKEKLKKTQTKNDVVLDTLQKLQLKCVKELDRICRKHEIEYTLGGGTCLGRVRHGGFIPWDDDIDIDMTLDNYDKFMEVASQEIDCKKFKLVSRVTEKKHYRTAARLELVETQVSMPRWDKNNIKVGIYIDIFRVVYLPEDFNERKKVCRALFLLRATENYMMTKDLHKALTNWESIKVRLASKIRSPQSVIQKEEKIIEKKCAKPTNWRLADSLLDSNIAGYQVDEKDIIVDVQFEGLTLMDRENPNKFLKALYGEDYMNWLPPVKRISHHKWTKFDLGKYADNYELPENYADYITVNYNEDKLQQMQEASLFIADVVDDICNENHLKYWVIGYNALLAGIKNKELEKYWMEPLSIGMPRGDYEKFLELCKKTLDGRFFLQSFENDEEYYYEHARIRLEHTELRDGKLNLRTRDKIHNGFYIRIIPLDEAGENQEALNKKIDKLSDRLYVKWNLTNINSFFNSRKKTKLRIIFLLPFSKVGIWNKILRLMRKSNELETNKYRISLDDDRISCCIEKDILGDGERMKYCGHSLVFPSKLGEYMKARLMINSRSTIFDKTGDYVEIEDKIAIKDYINNLIIDVQKKYPRCTLGFYDNEDYQLSVVRYDEKNDKFLSNEEMIKNVFMLL